MRPLVRLCQSAAVVALVLSVSACDSSGAPDAFSQSDDGAELVDASEFAVPAFAQARQRVTRAGGMDDVFMGVNGRMKGFGGFYFDDAGQLAIVVQPRPGNGNARPDKSKRKLMQAMSKLENVEHLVPDMEAATPVLVAGTYDFLDLAAWREVALDGEDFRGLLTFTDLDETTNRLVVGVSNAADVGRVRSAALAAGVPEGALTVVQRDPIVTAQEIDGTFSRGLGGIRIGYSDPESGATGGCTLGFNAVRNGVRGFVTNSHCTQGELSGQPVIGGARNASIFQPSVGSRLIGREGTSNVFDPRPTSCPPGVYAAGCRNSDAAFIPYESSYSSDLGRIARTVARSTAPFFTIVGRSSFPSVGQVVEKVGVLSGWTSATVRRTDVVAYISDQPGGGVALDVGLPGQVLAEIPSSEAEARSGDSGSPVFRLSGSGVTLTGVLHSLAGGRTVGSSVFSREIVFSPLSRVEQDLGPLTVF